MNIGTQVQMLIEYNIIKNMAAINNQQEAVNSCNASIKRVVDELNSGPEQKVNERTMDIHDMEYIKDAIEEYSEKMQTLTQYMSKENILELLYTFYDDDVIILQLLLLQRLGVDKQIYQDIKALSEKVLKSKGDLNEIRK